MKILPGTYIVNKFKTSTKLWRSTVGTKPQRTTGELTFGIVIALGGLFDNEVFELFVLDCATKTIGWVCVSEIKVV